MKARDRFKNADLEGFYGLELYSSSRASVNRYITVRTHLGRLLHPATCNRNLRAAAYLTCNRLVHEIGEDAITTLHRLDLEGVAMSLEIGGFYGGGSEGQRNEFYCKNLR